MLEVAFIARISECRLMPAEVNDMCKKVVYSNSIAEYSRCEDFYKIMEKREAAVMKNVSGNSQVGLHTGNIAKKKT